MKLALEKDDVVLSYDSTVEECPIRLQGNLYVEHPEGGLQFDFPQLDALKGMIAYLSATVDALEQKADGEEYSGEQ